MTAVVTVVRVHLGSQMGQGFQNVWMLPHWPPSGHSRLLHHWQPLMEKVIETSNNDRLKNTKCGKVTYGWIKVRTSTKISHFI